MNHTGLAGASMVLLLPLSIVAGVLATLAMDLVMRQLPEGETPPAVAAGVLTETNPGVAPKRLAKAVHYLAGALTGPLFVWLLLASEALLGTGLTAVLVAVGVLLVLMVAFFVGVVLPRSAGLAKRRVRQVGRDWALSAGAYVVVLTPLVVGLGALV